VRSDVTVWTGDRIRREVRFETFTPGGPGGQHANRTASAVRAVHIPTGISAVAREHRSQARNRVLALERLVEKLKIRQRRRRPRIATSIPEKARTQRRKLKEHTSKIKVLRRKIEKPEE
jgi:protein subunit release factor B